MNSKAIAAAILCTLGFCITSALAWQSDNGNGTFNNPVLYADYPDPDIIRVNTNFYMISTTFADSPGINVLESPDLVNWQIISHCCTNLDWSPLYNMVGGTAYRQGFWASSLRYYNGTFYVVANPVGINARIYYATNAAGPWQYYQLNQGLYDPGLLIDTNGIGYIFYGYSPQQSVATLNANFSQIVSVSNNVVLSGGEGSHAVRVGNYYYLFNANPGVWPYQLLCARATNIFGPWQTNFVCTDEIRGGHQGSIVDLDNSGTNYYGFVMKDCGAIGRMTYMCPIVWSNNWPIWGSLNAAGYVPAVTNKPILGQPLLQPATSDEFTNTTLGLQWQWNHNPDNTKWSLTARPGYLRLMPTQATNFWVARNTLTQKGQGPWSRGEISLDVSHLQPGDICGFGTLGMTNGQIAVNCDQYGNKYLRMNVIVPTTNSPGLSVSQTSYGRVPVTGTNLYLRVDMDFNASLGTCSYSFDDTNWATLGGQFNLAYDISVSTFQGEKYVIFCYNPSLGSGYVDVDWFHFSDKIQRGRPHLNAAHTTFVADNGELLRGPFTSTEWTGAVPASDIVSMKSLGFNAIHLYAESFDPSYPTNGSTAPGYSVANVDAIVAATRNNGMYLVITIGNGANNGDYNLAWATNFWKFYAPRYANETHVIYEIHNEPVAWGPSYLTATTPPGALNMEEACYNIIRASAPNTPVLLFTYAVFGGTGGTSAALTDIHAFNGAVFGNTNAVWTNEAVAFHGYAGWAGTSTAVAGLIAAGYPCMMTEFAGGVWGTSIGGLDAELTSELERQNVSWLTFQHTPSSGVSADVSQPQSYKDIVNNSGLSWNPDYGNWPPARGPFGNGGQPWNTTTNWVNNFLTGILHIEAENFDTGGEGVAYHELTANNTGGQYRTNEAVDIETTTDTGGGYDVTGTAVGEWLEYTIWVQNPGYYNLALRYATPNNNCAVQALGYGRDKTGTWTLPATGSYSTWQTTTQQVFLEWGRQKLHLNILNGGFNLNWMELSPATNGIIANGTYKFLNAANALTPTGVTSNSTIIGSGYTGSTYQQWNLQHIGAGQYQVTCAANGWSLTGESGFYSWNNEHFIIEPTSGGYFRLQSTGGSCLETVSGNPTSIDEATYSGDANQQWAVVSPSAPAFPAGLSALVVSSTQISLTWNAVTGASSYSLKRSTNSGGPYTLIASGITATNFTDFVATVRAGYYYVVSAVVSGSETSNSPEAAVRVPKLTGGIIGTAGSWNNSGNTITNVFDNNLNTYFDAPSGDGDWVGLDFGVGVTNVITQINYCPRSSWESRMTNGIFQGANNLNFTGAVTLFTITNQPATGVFTSVTITNTTAFRYVRYLSPNASYGNVAELEFYGYQSFISTAVASAPIGLAATTVSSSQINLTWNTVTNAASYNVKRSATNGGPYVIIASGVTATNYNDTGLAAATTYYYVASAVNAGGESTNSAQAAAATFSPTLGSLVHRYSFSETNGTTVADSVGRPVWNGTLPNGGTLSNGVLMLSSGSSQYANLPAGIVSSLTNCTIMAWVNLNSTATWSRVFDFGNNTTNYMFLTPQCSGSGTLRFAITTNGNGGEQQINCALPLGTGAWHQVAVTLNTNRGILYLDGVAVGTNTSMMLNPAILGVTTNNYIGKSQWPDPYFNGLFDEFRIYNVGLSSAEIAATAALGSGGLLSTNNLTASLTRTGTNLTVSWPLANAGFTVQSRTNLALGNWLNVASPAPQITGGQWQVTLPQSTNSFNFYRLVK